jgi:sulfite oxidase
VAVDCDILDPTDGDVGSPGALAIHSDGIAGDGRSVERVDVSLGDGRTWRQADLHPAPSKWSWRAWSLTLSVQPRPLNLTARARDDTGVLQPESVASLWNPRGHGNNACARVALSVGGVASGAGVDA